MIIIEEKRKKKILFVSGSSKPIPAAQGGAIEYLTQKLIEYSKQTKTMIEFYVLSNSLDLADNPEAGVFYYREEDNFLYKNRVFLYKCTNRLMKNKQKYTQIKANLLTKLNELSKIYHFDEIIMLNYGIYCPEIKKFYSGKLSLYLHNDYLNKHTYQKNSIKKSIDRVISVSSFINQKVQEIVDDPDDFSSVIIENGIDMDRFHPVTSRKKILLRSQYGIGENISVILFSGRVERSKGITYLIEAIQKIDNKEIMLLIVGMSNNKHLLKKITQAGINVKVIGQVSQEQMPIYYQIADVCVIPSVVQESFCLVNIEAQACGTPVISTDAGALKEYFYGNKHLQVPTNSKSLTNNLVKSIQFFLQNKELINQIDYRKHAKIFSLEKMYRNLIQEVMK